jgi:hypothetical protein
MKSVCRLGAVEFGFKVFSFQFHPGKFMSPPMIIIALCIALALVTDVSKLLILSSKGYILHRKDRNSKNHRTGGGVLLAIKNEYNSEYVPENQYVDWEQ